MDSPPQNRSFLLTAWAERRQCTKGATIWRFGLEDVHSKKRRCVFASLEEVMLAVQTEISGSIDRPMSEDEDAEAE